MRRTLTLFLTLVLLWILVAEVNHLVTGLRIYLYVAGLFVAFAALTQPFRPGLVVSILGGLVCDANMPIVLENSTLAWSLGHLHTLLFAAAHIILFHLRDRVPREDGVARVIVALFTNLALFLLFSFVQITVSPAPDAAWPRLLVDLVCSQLFLALIGPWFFALQARALVLAQVERDAAA